ncbi:MAG: FkbM family methyltransferase [Gammaproteobacteria bacterium]|nr:FkbM family methyltransferase [Gammaproteobacteria bacterium]MBU1722343.1 FkbM family methyltransferase [Gammaproteobacteria bacterium]MBU2004720.1 FkbM family methyltransferase [Gammaproteobacteria bacterium]
MKPADFQKKHVYRFKNRPDGEQELVRDFFNHKSDGFYVDVGANHPTIESQTYHVEQRGWDGLLIEPLTSYVKLLKQQRKGYTVQAACSSPENHDKILKLLVAGGHSTLNADPIAVGTHSSEYAQVTCKTLDSILEENHVPLGFDFISIDIEGHEMEMFKGFTLTKWKPRLVLIEDHVTTHEKHNHMINNGYQLLLRTGLNSWYVQDSENFSLSLRAKLEFFRKYWLGLFPRKLRYSR